MEKIVEKELQRRILLVQEEASEWSCQFQVLASRLSCDKGTCTSLALTAHFGTVMTPLNQSLVEEDEKTTTKMKKAPHLTDSGPSSNVKIMLPKSIAPIPPPEVQNRMQDLERLMSNKEKEMKGVVENCRAAVEREYKLTIEDLITKHRITVEEKDKLIDSLKEACNQKDELCNQLSAVTATNGATLQEKLREQKREFLARESDIKSNVSRMSLDKEKSRFQAESARNNAESIKLSLEALKKQIQNYVGQEKHPEEINRFLESEKQQRFLLECSAINELVLWQYAEQMQQDLLTRLDKKWKGKFHSLYEVIEGSLQENVSSPTSSTPSANVENQPTESKAKSLIQQRLLSDQGKIQQLTQTIQTQDENMTRLLVFNANLEEKMTNHEAFVKEKLNFMVDKISYSENKVHRLSIQAHQMMDARANSKASKDILNAVVLEHEKEIQHFTSKIQQLEEESHHYKFVNKVSEAEEYKLKAEMAAGEVRDLQSKISKQRGESNALSTALADAEGANNELVGQMKSTHRELQDLRKDKEEAELKFRAEIQKLKDQHRQVIENYDDICKDRDQKSEKISQMQKEIQELKKTNETLKQKWIEFGGVSHLNDASSPSDGISDIRFDSTNTGANVSAELQRYQEREQKLENKMLALRQEKDNLVRQLDSAMAEISSAEERAAGAMERLLAFMSADDAAPKREQAIQSKFKEIAKAEKTLQDREDQLHARAMELERKDQHINRTIAQYQSRGANILASYNELSSARKSARSSQDGEVSVLSMSLQPKGGRNTSTSDHPAMTASLTANLPTAATKLTPLAHRPVSVPLASSQPNPVQRQSVPTPPASDLILFSQQLSK